MARVKARRYLRKQVLSNWSDAQKEQLRIGGTIGCRPIGRARWNARGRLKLSVGRIARPWGTCKVAFQYCTDGAAVTKIRVGRAHRTMGCGGRCQMVISNFRMRSGM